MKQKMFVSFSDHTNQSFRHTVTSPLFTVFFSICMNFEIQADFLSGSGHTTAFF